METPTFRRPRRRTRIGSSDAVPDRPAGAGSFFRLRAKLSASQTTNVSSATGRAASKLAAAGPLARTLVSARIPTVTGVAHVREPSVIG
jgi:hypothetical protein